MSHTGFRVPLLCQVLNVFATPQALSVSLLETFSIITKLAVRKPERISQSTESSLDIVWSTEVVYFIAKQSPLRLKSYLM